MLFRQYFCIYVSVVMMCFVFRALQVLPITWIWAHQRCDRHV